MNNELPNIKIPPCHCGREAVLNICKRQGEAIYKISCRVHCGGKWADTIDKAILLREVCDE